MPRRRPHASPAICAVLALVSAAAAGPPGLTTEVVVDGLAAPIYATHAPGDVERIFILERAGRIRVVHDGVLLPDPFLDLTGVVTTTVEGGLLGLAFDPNYEANGWLYVHYTTPNEAFSHMTNIARFTRSAGSADLAVPASEMTVLRLPRTAFNHIGGSLNFSPLDDYLYVALGDGDIPQSAQTLTDLNGKILRLDVAGDDFPLDPDRNYAIPPTNPFVGLPGADEVWAYGLRNPYRCSFDRETGDFWIGDVGDSIWEEIDFQPAASAGGENYGWDCMEGNQCHSSVGDLCTCNAPALTLPIFDYDHSNGCSVTGGIRYRGCAMPEHHGRYFFSDFCRCTVSHFLPDGSGGITDLHLGDDGFWGGCNIVGFGEDAYGEILVCALSGEVSRIVPMPRATDTDGDGIPDSCEPDPADINADGVVNFGDLLIVLQSWGPCPAPCAPDLDGSGNVDFADLLVVLTSWTF